MKIKELTIRTSNLVKQVDFYSNQLKLEPIQSNAKSASFRVGWSILTLIEGELAGPYHFCFLIPKNKLQEALKWAEGRLPLLLEEKERKVHHFESWNADSFYFLDAEQNILEFIVRHDLDNTANESFSEDQILCINEIGMPVIDIAKANEKLHHTMQTGLWKGDLERFGVHGDQHALLLLPNPARKKVWYPTQTKLSMPKSEIKMECLGSHYDIIYDGEIKFLN